MNILFIIATGEGETIYNAMRLANVGTGKGDDERIQLGKGLIYMRVGFEPPPACFK